MENKIILLTTLADNFSCFKQKTFVFQKKNILCNFASQFN